MTKHVISWMLLAFISYAACTTDEEQLMEDLFKDYNPRSRPVEQGTDHVRVNMGLAIREIVMMDLKGQVMTTSVWMRHYWTDPRLTWNPQDYGGHDEIHLSHKNHWKPDIVLFNSASDSFGPTYSDVITPINSSGYVTYMYPAILRTSCVPDVRYFPFDQQTCELSFMSWAYSKRSLDVQLKEGVVIDTSDYVADSEWDLVGVKAERQEAVYGCCPDSFPSLHFSLTLRRHAWPYVFYILFPDILINLVTCFQFLLPCDSGERVTLGITVLLSMVVNLLLLSEYVPMSNEAPLLGIYSACTLVTVVASLVITFFVVHVHHNGLHDNEIELPQWARRIILHGLARYMGLHRFITSDTEHESKMHPYVSDCRLVEGSFLDTRVVLNDGDQDLMDQDEAKPSSIKGDSVMSANLPRDSILSAHLNLGMKGSDILKQYSAMNVQGVPSSSQNNYFLYRILKCLDSFQEKFSKKDKADEVRCEWQQVAMVIDRLLFWIFLIVTIIMLLSVMCARPFYDSEVIR